MKLEMMNEKRAMLPIQLFLVSFCQYEHKHWAYLLFIENVTKLSVNCEIKLFQFNWTWSIQCIVGRENIT